MNNFEGSKLPFPLPMINIYNTLKEQECSICLEPLLNEDSHLRQLTCGHTFHKVCVVRANCDGYYSNNANFSKNPCPFCRQIIQQVGYLFIEDKGNSEKKVQITLNHDRGYLQWGILLVDENTKMKKIMEICIKILGQTSTYIPNGEPLFPFLLESKDKFQYSPSLDLNNDKTLQSYGIKNGDSITVSHGFKYIW